MCVSGESGRSQFRAHCWDRGFAEKPSVAPKQALLDAGAELKGSMQPPLIKHLKHPIVSKPQRRFERLMTYCMGNRQTFSLVIKTNSSLTIKRSRFFFQETNTHSFGLLDGWPKSSIIWIISETPVLFCYLQACLEFKWEVHIKTVKGICQLQLCTDPTAQCQSTARAEDRLPQDWPQIQEHLNQQGMLGWECRSSTLFLCTGSFVKL